MSQPPFPQGPPPRAVPPGAQSGIGPDNPPPTWPPLAAAPPPYQPLSPYGAPPGSLASGPDATARTGLPYHLLLRGGLAGTWWRALIGIFCLALGMVLLSPLVMMVPFLGYYLLTGQDVGSSISALIDTSDPTPAGLAYVNLALAGLIPVTWGILRWLHGLRPRWLSSIRPRLRWGYLSACFGLSLVALIATLLVAALLPSTGTGAEVSGQLNAFTPEIRDFLLVVLLLTPLQAAAEEYAFRGYLLQAFGGMVRHPALAVGLSALLFALAHGAQDPPIFVDRFAFGLVAGTLVIVTGGLEASLAMHVLNNWLAFGIALAYGDMGSALNPTGGTWWSLPVTLTQSLVYLALAWWVARLMGLSRRTDPTVLAGLESRV